MKTFTITFELCDEDAKNADWISVIVTRPGLPTLIIDPKDLTKTDNSIRPEWNKEDRITEQVAHDGRIQL